jgi:hypothetical protein
MADTVRVLFGRGPTGRDLILEWFKNDNFCNGIASLDCFSALTSTV